MINLNTSLKLLLIIGLAVFLRFYGIKWDQGNFFHPDERFLAMVTNDLKLPGSFSEYLDPAKSSLNPYNSKYTFFVYGTFPVNLNKFLVNLFNQDDYYSIGIYGRAISALFDLATLIFIFLTVRLWERFYTLNPSIKYLAAFFYAISVLPIQHAHFFTVDSFLNFFMFSAFYFAVRACFFNKIYNTAFAAVLFGFGMGTKVSAVYILPLLLLFLFLEKDQVLSHRSILKGLPLKLFKLALFVCLSYLTLRAADPRFFADGNLLNFSINPRFIANLKELAGSGNFGDGLPSPPSVQWIRSPHVFFALKNIVVFGVGIPYFLLSVFGIYWLYKKRSREVFFILAWAACFFLWQSSQFVKSMRYFYCLYPFLAILAACGFYYLTQLLRDSKYKKIVMGAIAAAVLAWPYSFMQIYTKPHSRVMASEWIYKNIPQGKRLAQIHWDDFLPVPLPGYQRDYDISEMAVFGPDDDSKWQKINEELLKTDYIIFSSNRGYGSIMPLPDKYPRMSPFFRDLFEGRSNFKLVADINSYPTLNLGFLSIPFNDQWAEEAFSVYDHPRVTVFKKAQSDTPINGIINSSAPRPGLPGSGSMSSFLVWVLLIQLLALALLPYLSAIFPRYPDKAYGLSKTAGFFFFGLLTWLIPAYVNIPANSQLCTFVFFILIAIGFRKSGGLAYYSKFYLENKLHVLRAEALFMGGFVFFLALRWANPEIYWGEKPMDSSLLYYFTRSETIPPSDPWSSGTNMRYYYLGSYIVASFLKVTGISPAIGYNLGIAIIPAFCLASLYTLFNAITRKANFSVFAALCVILLSNPEIINLVFFHGKSVNFDTFWASTRLFNSPGFTEYPLWSYLFADLHAHVISQVACAVILAIFPAFLSTKDNFTSRLQVTILGVFFSCLLLLNSWDFLTYGLLIALAFTVKLFFAAADEATETKIKMLAKEVLIILACGLIITVPYQLSSNPAEGVHWGWNGDKEYNHVTMIFRHFGAWLVISALSIFIIFKKKSRASQIGPINIIFISLLSLVPIALGLAGYYKGLIPPPWGILILSSIVIHITLILLSLNKSKSTLLNFSSLGLLTFGLVLGVIEMLFLIDRMNSIFKFYYSLWMITSTSSLAFSIYLFRKIKSRKGLEKYYLIFGKSSVIFIIAVCLLGSFMNIWQAILHKRTDGPRFTLNGQAYLEKSDKDEYALINWINSNISGPATIVEAQGDSYGPFTRIVMHTGLSTVLGWEYHVKQRGTKEHDIFTRKSDIKQIYSSPDPQYTERLLDKYGVQLIVVGELEIKTYPITSLDKFSRNPDLFPLLFKSGNTALYTRSKALLSTTDSAKLKLEWK